MILRLKKEEIMTYATLILTITLLAGLAVPESRALSLDPGPFLLADSYGSTDGAVPHGSTGGDKQGDVSNGGTNNQTKSDASQSYDAPRTPIGDITKIAPSRDVASPTDVAKSLARFAKAIKRAKNGGAPVSILQYGDSHVARGVEPETIDVALGTIAPLHYHTMAKIGISSNYPCLDPSGWLDRPIKQANPDLVIIAFGSNDSATQVDKTEYRQTYQNLINAVKARAPNASILIVGPADGDSIRGANKGRTLPGLDVVVEVQRELAAKNSLDFFDLRQSMGGPGSIEDWYTRDLAGADKLHFTTPGYEIIGKSIVQHIQSELDQAQKP
jgi:lysophospholipase L1-like esterase